MAAAVPGAGCFMLLHVAVRLLSRAVTCNHGMQLDADEVFERASDLKQTQASSSGMGTSAMMQAS